MEVSVQGVIGRVDQILQFEQQVKDPSTVAASAASGGAGLSSVTGTAGSSATSGTSGTAATFAAALASAQSSSAAAVSGLGSTGSTDAASADPLASSADPVASSADSSTGAGSLESLLLSALPATSSAPTAAAGTATGATDSQVQAMVNEANSLVGKPYVWGGGHSGWGPQTGYDCSGFVSAVLHAGGYLSTPQDTVSLPNAPGIEAGPGQYVTIYDRDGAGEQGHVIIDIAGQFYESGGESGSWGGGGGVERISTPPASYLSTFDRVLHPEGL